LVSAKEIPPGGEGKIDVTFKTERRKGVNKKKITVTSNDPENPRLLLEISADLEQLLDASPRRQWFGRIKQDEVITKTFTFEGKEVDNIKIEKLALKDEANQDAYTWKILDEKTPEGRSLKVDVTVDASKIPPGRFNDVLIARTSLDEAGEVELYLSGEVLGPITINPRRLYFGQYELNQEMVKTVTLTSSNDIPFKILETSIPEQEFAVDPWNREAALEHTLTIRLSPKMDRDRIRSAMTIKTDMKDQDNVEVDIHAYKRRSRPGPNPAVQPRGEMKRAEPVAADDRIDSRQESRMKTREIEAGVQ